MNKSNNKFGTCPLCNRKCKLTFHHLVPKKLHRRVRFKKRFSREELNIGIAICRLCHDGIHDLYDEMHLGRNYKTFDDLVGDEALRRHFNWVSKQKYCG